MESSSSSSSSEPSFSNISSISSKEAENVDENIQPPVMAHGAQRTDMEKKLIDQAVGSLLGTLEKYKPYLAHTDYGYFCQFATNYLNEKVERKARGTRRNALENSMMTGYYASDVGSVRSAYPPLRQFYPSNSHHGRAPSVVSSVAVGYPGQLSMPRHMQQSVQQLGHDSFLRTTDQAKRNPKINNARSQPPVVKRTRDPTLLQAVMEAEESVVENQRLPELPTPSTSSGDQNDMPMQVAKVVTQKKEVPKSPNGVIKLYDWSLKLLGEHLHVTGTTRDGAQVTSAPILKYSHPHILTAKQKFAVVNEPNFSERTPAFVKSACNNGFPRQWNALRKRWFADRQARRKSTPKKTPERKNNKNNSASGKKMKDSAGKPSKSTERPSELERPKSASKKSTPKEQSNKSSSIKSPHAAKQTKTIVTKRRSKESSEKKKQHDSPDEEEYDSESLEQPTSKSRSLPAVKSKSKAKVQPVPSEDESESEDDEEQPARPATNPAKRALKQQELGSDTSWDTSTKLGKSPASKAPPKRAPKTNKQNEKKTTTTSATGEPKQKNKTAKSINEQKAVAKTNPIKEKPHKKDDKKNKVSADLFGDDGLDELSGDAFSALGPVDFHIAGSRSMTPNTLVASIQPDAGTIGRYTPPLANVLDLFSRQSQAANSSFGSPSSLKNENVVSKRIAKDMESKKKGGSKKAKPIEPEHPNEMDNIIKSMNPSNALKTPTLVKKIFRNERDDDEDSRSSDLDESMVY